MLPITQQNISNNNSLIYGQHSALSHMFFRIKTAVTWLRKSKVYQILPLHCKIQKLYANCIILSRLTSKHINISYFTLKSISSVWFWRFFPLYFLHKYKTTILDFFLFKLFFFFLQFTCSLKALLLLSPIICVTVSYSC